MGRSSRREGPETSRLGVVIARYMSKSATGPHPHRLIMNVGRAWGLLGRRARIAGSRRPRGLLLLPPSGSGRRYCR
jgi:hypothetical protein